MDNVNNLKTEDKMDKYKISNDTLSIKCPYCKSEQELIVSQFETSQNGTCKKLYYTSQMVEEKTISDIGKIAAFILPIIAVFLMIASVQITEMGKDWNIDFSSLNIKSVGFAIFIYGGTWLGITYFFKYRGFVWLSKCENCSKQIFISKKKNNIRVYHDGVKGINLPTDEINENSV